MMTSLNLNNIDTFIISAPSATGKTTLIRKLLEKHPKEIALAVTSTTRSKRTNEKHGVDYFFINREEFESQISKHQFLEWAKVHDNYYGSNLQELQRIHDSQKSAILIIDVKGCLEAKKKLKNAASIFIMPPHADALKARMDMRGGDDQKTRKKRMQTAIQELSFVENYDFFIINESLDLALNELRDIIIKRTSGGLERSAAIIHAERVAKAIKTASWFN